MTKFGAILRPMNDSNFCPQHRTCLACGKSQALSSFHVKPGGLAGRDSQCRICINKTKMTRRRLKKAQSRRITSFDSEIVGNSDEYSIQEFGRIFGRGIASMLEMGLLK